MYTMNWSDNSEIVVTQDMLIVYKIFAIDTNQYEGANLRNVLVKVKRRISLQANSDWSTPIPHT